MKHKLPIGMTLFFLGVVLLFVLIFIAAVSPATKEKVNCYDEHHNKIIGLECEQTGADIPGPAYFLLFSIPLMVIGAGIHVLGLMASANEESLT